MAILKYHAEAINCLDFSKDNILACGSKDGKISLWDVYGEKWTSLHFKKRHVHRLAKNSFMKVGSVGCIYIAEILSSRHIWRPSPFHRQFYNYKSVDVLRPWLSVFQFRISRVLYSAETEEAREYKQLFYSSMWHLITSLILYYIV